VSYLLLKWVHIVSSTVLFGTGMGIAFFQFMTWRSGDVAAIARVTRLTVIADFVFTTPAVVVQLATGFALLHVLSLPWTTAWIQGALALYALAGACWLPVVWMQLRMTRLAEAAAIDGAPLPEAYHRLFRWWFALGWPAFAGVLGVYWLMIAKPMF